MKKRKKYSIETKIKACIEYEQSGRSLGSIGRELDVHRSCVSQWVMFYKEHGPEGFYNKKKESDFTEKKKQDIVKEYIDGEGSFAVLAGKYNINVEMIRKWVNKWYNYEYNEKKPKGDKDTMKARKTTFEERVEIVKWVAANDFNYNKAAEKLDLNYALIYKWTKAYLDGGEEALEYKKRGPKKKTKIDESNLTDTEKLKLALEREKALRKKLEIELMLHKKKAEIEEKLLSQKFDFLQNTKR